MVGKRFSDFLNMAGRIYYETHIAPLLRMQGFFNEFALDMLKANGEPVQMIANALEGRDAAGKPMFIRLALIKATDRRRYEHELLEARDVAKTSLNSERETAELREQFIAVLGHDLRNPLASISAGARILGRNANTDKEHQVVAMMQTTVMRMAGLIDNVLDFARGRLGGGLTLDRDAHKPLEPVLHQVIDELRLSSPGRQIDAEYAIDVPVNCDRAASGNSFPISSETLSATEHPTNLCAFVQQPRMACSGSRSQTVANPYPRVPWKSCLSRFSAARFAPAVKASASDFTLLRRSQRLTKVS